MEALARRAQRLIAAPILLVVGVVVLVGALVFGLGLWVLGLAILIPTAVAVYRRPQRGVLIMVAILPFDGMLKVLGPGVDEPVEAGLHHRDPRC